MHDESREIYVVINIIVCIKQSQCFYQYASNILVIYFY